MSRNSHRLLPLWSASLIVCLTFPCWQAFAANGDCGIPFTSGNAPKTSDCLFILRAGVELEECANCVCDTNGSGGVSASDAQLCLRHAVGQVVELLCPVCDAIGTCPGTVEWTTHAGLGRTCSDNADCDAGRCDPVTDRCVTDTRADIGWTGHGHGIDLGDSSTALRVDIDCAPEEAPCAECEVQGIVPSDGACRCSNDTRAHCDDPFEVDSDCPTCVAGAFVGTACASNTDCEAGSCVRRCSNDLSLTCENSGDCPGGTCKAGTQCLNGKPCLLEIDCMGTCTGGALCRCFDGPPIAMSAGDEPYCLVQRLASDLTGTVNVDTGASGVIESLQLLVHLGISEGRPCPVCGGLCDGEPGQECIFDSDCGAGDECEYDPVAGDGARGGACVGGPSNGMPCDVESVSSSFPVTPEDAGGGAGTSLDCMPSAGLNLSGSAQVLQIALSTEASDLPAGLSCGGANVELSCPCLVCSTNPARGCRSDADCAAERGSCSSSAAVLCDVNADCTGIDGGPCLDNDRCQDAPLVLCANDGDCDVVNVGVCELATCSDDAGAGFPLPNACDDGLCTDSGDGEGECTTGPDDLFCDDLLAADGSGLLACTGNADCPTHVIQTMSGGTCSLLQRRRCFVDPIVASGDSDPRQPVLAASFCMAPTLSLEINENLGLPGPVRWVRQTSQLARCATAPSQFYEPGLGGCP